MHPPTSRSFYVFLFLLFFISYAYFYNGSGWNQEARFAQMRSIVHEGTLSIDSFAETTKDIAVYKNRIYPNKPPGSSMLGLPPYALLVWIEKFFGGEPTKNPALILWNTYYVNILANAMLSALGAVFFFRLLKLVTKQDMDALLICLAYGLGTMVFPYSTVYLGHAQALALYTIGFFYFYRAFFSAAANPCDLFYAGLWMSSSVLVDFFMVSLVFVCWAYFFWTRAPLEKQKKFLLGAAGPFCLLLAYQWIAFGNPFSIPMGHNLPMFQYNRSDLFLGAFQWPPGAVMRELLTGDHYGLFTFNPILIFGVVGLVKMRKELPGMIVLQCLLTFFFGSAFIGWWGGHTAGPRYLMGCIPCLLFASAFLVQSGVMRSLFCVIVLWSFYVNLAVTATNPLPGQMKSLKQDILPAMQACEFSTNKTFPYLPPNLVSPEWKNQASFNWGQKMGIPNDKSLWPLLGIQVILLIFLFCRPLKKK
jgi:hypothetical protein